MTPVLTTKDPFTGTETQILHEACFSCPLTTKDPFTGTETLVPRQGRGQVRLINNEGPLYGDGNPLLRFHIPLRTLTTKDPFTGTETVTLVVLKSLVPLELTTKDPFTGTETRADLEEIVREVD